MTKPNELINQVANFYKQYLDCSPDQLDLLALWTMHTHIIPAAPFSPALNICSRQKHSGKTLCLQLLSLLCDGAWMHTAAAPSLLLHQLTDGDEPFGGTLLLDDCDATFGKSRMNIKLQGLFNARFQQDARFTVRVKDGGEYIFDHSLVFFPAAFAGNGRLHPCLAERSIQIALEPKKPGSPCQPFRFYAVQNSARSLWQSLSDWGDANHERFGKIAPYKEDQFPPELSWRARDCAEPLLHVADFIGGDWPLRARQALANAFALAAFEDFYSSKLVLSDIRDAFAEKGNPEWISSADLLEYLHTMDNRPWDEWTKGKPMHPKSLSHLLEPFGIHPRNHRTGPKTIPKGYYRQDLEPLWSRHLPVLYTDPALRCQSKDASSCGEGIVSPAAISVAANLQDSTPVDLGLAASSQKLAANSVSANLQNSTPGSPKPAASSQKPGAAIPVAANLQKSGLTNSKPEPVLPKQVGNFPIVANGQNSIPDQPQPQPAASSQKLGANIDLPQIHALASGSAQCSPAGAEFLSPARECWEGYGEKPESRRDDRKSLQPETYLTHRSAGDLTERSWSTATPGAGEGASGSRAVPVAANVQNSIPDQPQLAASSRKPVANTKPTIGERILSLPRQALGGNQQMSFTREALIGTDTGVLRR